jgi:cell division protease FtsH
MNFKGNAKSIALWVIVALFLVALFNIYQGSFRGERQVVPLSEFIESVKSGKVQEVMLKDQELQAIDKDKRAFVTHAPRYYNPIPLLTEQNVRFQTAPPDTSSFTLFALFQMLFPLLLFGGAWFFFFRQIQNNNGRAMGFGRSKAKLADPQKNTLTFKDVEGIEEAKEDLREVVDFLRDPQRFQAIGGKIPKGILLVGPPGTGKTLLAKAVSGEAKVPFFSVSGSDFVEMFVGVGASRVRDLFAQAKQHAPCIVFIDEIDAVGRHRSMGGPGGGHDEREQTLNQLLVEMDGFDPKEEVIIMAATNRLDVLDSALLRPGRFDRNISVDLPDLRGRERILGVHLRKVRVVPTLCLETIARGTPGFSGADLANLVNEAALLAARFRKKVVDQNDFEIARDKLLMGSERRSLVMTEDERKLTAYHESGHAIVAYHSPHSDPIHKATIIPRGGALGMVVRLPEGDRVSISKQRLLADLAVAMGGRVAEELIFGEDRVTTGASSDLQQATLIAKNMVVKWGMSELGLVSYSGKENDGWRPAKEFSEEVMRSIDKEVKKILEQAHKQAIHILTLHAAHLEILATHLLENETLTGKEIDLLLTKGSFDRVVKVKSSKVAAKSSSTKRPRVARRAPVFLPQEGEA